ncbi:MAG: RIP metalloprotease RseP [Candidatus Omnitrophica bacterium]|nr:RIP metalloprotease RseP [Candidatus Omnitrophota bacterium]
MNLNLDLDLRNGGIILLTVIVVVVVFSFLVLIHEAGHLFAAKKAGIKVEAFSLGMGKRLFGITKGGTDYRVSLLPFGGYCKMAGDDPQESEGKDDEFLAKPVGHRFWVVAAGALTNYIFAYILFSVIFMIGVPTLSNRVGEVLKGYPAEEAGVKAGDRIISINGGEVRYWDDIVENIKKNAREGKALTVSVERGDHIRELPVEPDISKVKNIFGQTITRPLIGIAPQSELLSVSYGPVEAFYHGGRKLLGLTAMTYKGVWLLVTGGMPVKASVSGPIGIAHLMGKAARVGIVPLLIITAHVSMALAIFNLLPFPVLDGGHILFLGIEKIRNKPISARTQDVITNIALALLIAFALFISWNDLMKFTPLGKGEPRERTETVQEK